MTKLSCDSPCTRVYIEASYANPFRSGWGAVVVHTDGKVEELSESTEGETQPRSLLIGCLHVLKSIPQGVPVRFYSVHDFFNLWTIPLLSVMLADGFLNARRKGKKNLDLVEAIAVEAQSFPKVEAFRADKAELRKAEALAIKHGTEAGGFTVKSSVKPKRKADPKPKLKAKPTAKAITEIDKSDNRSTFQPDDLPFDL